MMMMQMMKMMKMTPFMNALLVKSGVTFFFYSVRVLRFGDVD